MDKFRFDRLALLMAVERKRAEAGMSKRQLANELGRSHSTVIEWATRGKAPDLDALVTLLAWLSADIKDFMEPR